MKLIEALEVIKSPIPPDAPELAVFLACGFTPLHLQTFLLAQLRMRHQRHQVTVDSGLFGDLAGNIERFVPSTGQSVAVVIEWSDLDPRLGIRTLGGWRPAQLSDIVASAQQATTRLLQAILAISRSATTVVTLPTLSLPPLFWMRPDRAGTFELRLHHIVASLAAALSEEPGIQIVNSRRLDELSASPQRFDPKSEVTSGFPYTLSHASVMAEVIAGLIENRPPKKGLITDLDNTLWAGILGEDGPGGISWHLERGTQMHGLYQQFVASLAGAGIFVGVASKNDPNTVNHAFDRTDLLVSRSDVFPFEVHWRSKSESVRQILDTWNIGSDSVVFIDDSPMEVAEVKAAIPEVECIVFPKDDPRAILALLVRLRGLFGKTRLTAEDDLRLESIRNVAVWREAARSAGPSLDDFLRGAEGSIVFHSAEESGDARAFELVNKTNQFNLNGKRLSDGEWRSFLNHPNAVAVSVSYKDKYGSLGKIAVILAKQDGRQLHVHSWVMSCRAFSRRIEHHCLRYLFDRFGVREIVFDYEPTSRNSPLQEFLVEVLGAPPTFGMTLSGTDFERRSPALSHHVEVQAHA